MRVDFRAKTVWNGMPVTNQMKENYETTILSFVETVAAKIHAALEAIIVPDDFFSEVLLFQKSIGEAPSLTNNEYASAVGKLLFDKNEDHFYIFLHRDIAQYLMSDTLLEALSVGMSKEAFHDLTTKKEYALNMLVHEIAHAKIYKQIWLYKEQKRGFLCILNKLSRILFDEYCACREACSIVTNSTFSTNENDIIHLENELITASKQHKHLTISAIQFADILFQNTELILKHLVSYIGSCDGINQSIEGYSECKIANYVGLFEKELSTMYVHLNTLKDIEYSALSQIILRYFSHLQIRIIELADGFCFEILS